MRKISTDVCCYGKERDNIITVHRRGFQRLPLKFMYLRSGNLGRVPACFDWILELNYWPGNRGCLSAADEKAAVGLAAGFPLKELRALLGLPQVIQAAVSSLCSRTTGRH